MGKPYFILSCDGGGVRGLLSSILLERLEKAQPGFLSRVDLFAGTSTGGIIALALAYGLKPTDLVKLYGDDAGKIFNTSIGRRIWTLNGLLSAKYSNKALHGELRTLLGTETKLKELKRKVLVSSFELDNGARKGRIRSWKPKFFHNYPGEDSDGDERVVDVALRTSAAPTYFPAYQSHIDGGVVANNPSMAAIVQALDHRAGKQVLPDIRLLSIGTGFSPTFIAGRTHKWGLLQWAKPMVPLLLDGAMGVVDFQCSRILSKQQYCRIAPELKQDMPLDDAKDLGALVALANAVDVGPAVKWLGEGAQP